MRTLLIPILLTAAAVAGSTPAAAEQRADHQRPIGPNPAQALLDSLQDEQLVELARETLIRNPQLAVNQATARAAHQRAPQARSLPDPVASLSLYLMQPQTRVGPQQAAVGITQHLPWFGELAAKEQAALFTAAAQDLRVEAQRLKLVTDLRRLYHELQFLAAEERIVREDRSTLEHYEELAQARYASGVGLGQSVVKLHAEITRSDARIIDIEQRRSGLTAEINRLRDRPGDSPIQFRPELPPVRELPPAAILFNAALQARPEIAEAQALIDAAQARIDVQQTAASPDFMIGLNYALVGRRDDRAGRANPPQDNGDDILGISGGMSVPVWRSKIEAGIEEALQNRLAAEEQKRATIARIEARLADLGRRIPLIVEENELYDTVLTVQAEESLHSAELAYASGTVSALDLLDSERVLLQVRVAAARAHTDLAVAVAELEGALGTPLTTVGATGEDS